MLAFKSLDEAGQGMVEYSLIIMLITIAVLFSLRLFGDNLSEFISWIANEFPASP